MKACSQALRIFTMLCNFHSGHFITLIFIKQLFSSLSSPQLLETMNLLSVFHKFIYSEIFNKGNHTVAGCWDSFLWWLTEDQCMPHFCFFTNPSHQHTLGLFLPSAWMLPLHHPPEIQIQAFIWPTAGCFLWRQGKTPIPRKALYHWGVAPAWTFVFDVSAHT